MIYTLVASVAVSAFTKVEASSEEEAIKLAKKRDVVISTGHDGLEPDEYWVIEDADGSPDGVHVE